MVNEQMHHALILDRTSQTPLYQVAIVWDMFLQLKHVETLGICLGGNLRNLSPIEMLPKVHVLPFMRSFAQLSIKKPSLSKQLWSKQRQLSETTQK